MEKRRNTVEEIREKIEQIEEQVGKIISVSKDSHKPTNEIAHQLADERILKKRKEQEAGTKA